MISHCLLPFMRAMPKPLTADGIRTLLAKQPEVCVRSDCMCAAGCRAVCREWAAVQWKCAQRKGLR